MPKGVYPRPYTAQERFEQKYVPEPNCGCWLWTAGVTDDGYGKFKVKGKMIPAHRFSYEQTNGPIPDGLWVLHKCDTPPCVNPAHLWLGTAMDNTLDSMKKDRHGRGERNGRAKLTEIQVAEIRARKGESVHVLSAEYGVSEPTIYFIWRGWIWK